MGEGIEFGWVLFIVACSVGFGWMMGRQGAENRLMPALREAIEVAVNRPGWLLTKRDADLITEIATEHVDISYCGDLIEFRDRLLKMLPPEVP